VNPCDPAFPETTSNPDLLPGLSIRAYFAAHAPKKPQSWFEPYMPPRPEKPPDKPVLPDDFPDRAEDRNFITNLAWNWRRDPCFDLSTYEVRPTGSAPREHSNALLAHARPALVEYETAWNAHWDQVRAWNDERVRQFHVQWPWAYADAVLAAGGAQ